MLKEIAGKGSPVGQQVQFYSFVFEFRINWHPELNECYLCMAALLFKTRQLLCHKFRNFADCIKEQVK